MIVIGSIILVIAYTIVTTNLKNQETQLRPIRIRVKRK